MSIFDFPGTPFPDGVECKQMTGFSIKVVDPTKEEGRCEGCRAKLSTHIFNVGITYHHLCKDCFEQMMKMFAEKSGSWLYKKAECAEKGVGTL